MLCGLAVGVVCVVVTFEKRSKNELFVTVEVCVWVGGSCAGIDACAGGGGIGVGAGAAVESWPNKSSKG